jgi:hypothetical protein
MAAPYNAKCDGVTDDHLAIQSALADNGAAFVPPGKTCYIGTEGLVLSGGRHSQTAWLFGNFSTLHYAGTETAVIALVPVMISDLQVLLTGATLENVFGITGSSTLTSISETISGPASGSYNSVNANGEQINIDEYNGEGNIDILCDFCVLSNSYMAGGLTLTGTTSSIESSIFGGTTSSITAKGAHVSSTHFGYNELETGSLTVSASMLTLSAVTVDGSLAITGAGTILNGDVEFGAAGTPAITGTFSGTLAATDSAAVPYEYINGNLIAPWPPAAGSGTNYDFQFTGCTIPTGGNAECHASVNFTTGTTPTFSAMPDTNYTAECTADVGSNTGCGAGNAVACPQSLSLWGKTASTINYQVGMSVNATNTAYASTIYCHLHHN